MALRTGAVQLYQTLADAYERLGQATMRDRFLMLAADAALQAGQPDEAERLRQRLLAASRHHMLRPYGSFEEAADAPDVQTYLRDLRLNYPPEVAEQMLVGLHEGGDRVERTQPLPFQETRSIPMTAPLMDLSSPPARPRALRPLVPDPEPYPVAATEPPRPRSPAERPPAPAPPPPPRTEPTQAPKRPARNNAAWVNEVLLCVVLLAGLAVAALAVGRPFFPDWLLP